MAGLRRNLGVPAYARDLRRSRWRCIDASEIRCIADGSGSGWRHAATSASSWRGDSRSAPSRTSSTCCGSRRTRATGRGRSSATGRCCRRRWTRSRRAAACRSSPTSGSAIRRGSTISSWSAGWSTRSRTCIPTLCASCERAAAAGVPLVGVCTGAFILHRAGLMHGYRACVSWFHHADFLERFDGLEPVSDQIFVVDRDRLTCSGGVSSAHLAAFSSSGTSARARAAKSLHIMIIDEAMRGGGAAARHAAGPRPPTTRSSGGRCS